MPFAGRISIRALGLTYWRGHMGQASSYKAVGVAVLQELATPL
jgi:hypothetical protein